MGSTDSSENNSVPKTRGCFPEHPMPVHRAAGPRLPVTRVISSPTLILLAAAQVRWEERARRTEAGWSEIGESSWPSWCWHQAQPLGRGTRWGGELPFPAKTAVVWVAVEILPAAGWDELVAAVSNLLAQTECSALCTSCRVAAATQGGSCSALHELSSAVWGPCSPVLPGPLRSGRAEDVAMLPLFSTGKAALLTRINKGQEGGLQLRGGRLPSGNQS